MKVAFQGEHGAYSEEAILQHFEGSAEPVPRPSLREVFQAVEGGEVDLGLVPVENTLEGSVVRTFDLLLESTLRVSAEVILRVVHCLIANPGVTIGDIKGVYSHPQALGQCRAYLESQGFEAVVAYDTAGSVKMLGERGLRDAAAIASGWAAEVYGMTVLARGIETHPENYTRFFVLGHEDHPPTGRDKTSIAFTVDHKPGILFRALRGFALHGVNLTKIESRPMVGRPWEYSFHMDFEGHRVEPHMHSALEELRTSTRFLKILGSYPRADNPLGPPAENR
ncbi:MAG: prephenate dehydratase [Candidatus Bathyarchaeota archaeon]|nr:prephenate dehydratase [Candidatus Bathyarchaeota archaeon]